MSDWFILFAYENTFWSTLATTNNSDQCHSSLFSIQINPSISNQSISKLHLILAENLPRPDTVLTDSSVCAHIYGSSHLAGVGAGRQEIDCIVISDFFLTTTVKKRNQYLHLSPDETDVQPPAVGPAASMPSFCFLFVEHIPTQSYFQGVPIQRSHITNKNAHDFHELIMMCNQKKWHFWNCSLSLLENLYLRN